jgi:hypothetical protein
VPSIVKSQPATCSHIGEDRIELLLSFPNRLLVHPAPITNSTTHQLVRGHILLTFTGKFIAIGAAIGKVKIDPAVVMIVAVRLSIEQPTYASS